MSIGTANERAAAQSTETASPTDNNPTLTAGSYPKSWDSYVGQTRAKGQMMEACIAAKLESVPLPHTLIESGMPGIGKTSLALLAADAMGCQVRIVAGKVKATEARMIFTDLEDGDILVIEEIHQLVQSSKRDAEWLIHYLQDGVLLGPLGIEEVPRVTVIATTTESSVLPEPVLQRFTLRPDLTEYSRDEAAEIAGGFFHRFWAEAAAKGLDLAPASVRNCFEVADAASRNPRMIKQMVETMKIKAIVNPKLHDGEHWDLAPMLSDRGFTADGLSPEAQKYLLVLLDTFRGEPAGEGAIKNRLRAPGIAATEDLLERKGLISFTHRGRMLSMAGVKRAKALKGLSPAAPQRD